MKMNTFKTNGANRGSRHSLGKKALSLLLAVILGIGGALSGMGDLLIKGSVDEAYAATGVTFKGNSDNFGDILPATKVYIDVAAGRRR